MPSSHSIEELVARQGLFSEVRRRSLEVPAPRARVAEGPWITVSRQLGSWGLPLAARVADTLGWRAYDREILAAIAAETRSQEVVLERYDEHAVREFDEYLAQLIIPDDPGHARYLMELAAVIVRIARQGRAVLVGRGAHFVLTPACGLRIRAVGALEARVAEVSRLEEVPLAEARRIVSENDQAQRAFIRQTFHKEIDDPSGYDLVLNVIDMGVDAALQSVLAAAKAKLGL
jgi:cytidylate kinase